MRQMRINLRTSPPPPIESKHLLMGIQMSKENHKWSVKSTEHKKDNTITAREENPRLRIDSKGFSEP